MVVKSHNLVVPKYFYDKLKNLEYDEFYDLLKD